MAPPKKSVTSNSKIEKSNSSGGNRGKSYMDETGQHYYEHSEVDGNDEEGFEVPIVDDQIHIANIDIVTDTVMMRGVEETGIAHEEDVEEENYGYHSRMMVQGTEFKCDLCDYVTYKKHLLQRHMICHSDVRLFSCKVCERRFKTAIALGNHVKTHTGTKPHSCASCERSFTTSGELVRHVRYKHSGEKPHKCTQCDYACVEMSKLRRHVLCHTGERPFQCTQCTYASQDNFKLKRHLRTHTGEKPYKCQDCEMSFTQSNSLKVHMHIHNTKEKPVYRCELCPATCGRMPDLRIHMQKQHNSANPVKCKKCSKTFPDNHTYKKHAKTHDGETFKCTYCAHESTSIRGLNSHVFKHTNQKPFACDECNQTFRQKQLLRRHQNINHNPDYVPTKPKEKAHKCQQCKRLYANKGNYLRHLALHHVDGDGMSADGNKESVLKNQSRRKSVNSDSEVYRERSPETSGPQRYSNETFSQKLP